MPPSNNNEEIPDEIKEKYNDVMKLIKLYSGSCLNCKQNTNSWNKVQLKCGCTTCCECLKGLCRYYTNYAMMQPTMPKEYGVCFCGGALDQNMVRIILKDEVDSIHRVVQYNIHRKAKEKGFVKSMTLLCVKCGKYNDIPKEQCQANMMCC